LYELSENIPSVEATLEKVLDGYPPIYTLATYPSTSASLAGRSNTKCTLGLAIYSDVQDSASGTPLARCTMSGVYVSQLSYTLPVQGHCTESVTLVGNNKIWNNSFTSPTFSNQDTPPSGVQKRHDVSMGSAGCKFPLDIPGLSASGYNEMSAGTYGAHFQSIKVSCNLGREELFELGRRGPYHRYVNFPVEVTSEFELLSLQGDGVVALEDSQANLTNRTIVLKVNDGTIINLGTKNKLSGVTYGGVKAGQQGGNATMTFSYTNYNDLTVTHPQDPSAL
jgi:hypothetical protein